MEFGGLPAAARSVETTEVRRTDGAAIYGLVRRRPGGDRGPADRQPLYPRYGFAREPNCGGGGLRDGADHFDRAGLPEA